MSLHDWVARLADCDSSRLSSRQPRLLHRGLLLATVGLAMLMARTEALAQERQTNAQELVGSHESREPDELAASARRLLSDRCFQCHGPDAATRAADLRLDTEEGIAQVANHDSPQASSLWQRLTADDPDLIMPPADSGIQLSSEERQLLLHWLEQGSPWPMHWSFRAMQRMAPPVPSTRQTGDAVGLHEIRNPIDGFIHATLQERGMSGTQVADRATLLRRVTLDLTGLPPDPHELQAFLSDSSPDAYERAVERLFRSPHYGEHQALTWLDAARYADTDGYQVDWERTMWPWRDWIIDAYNQAMPFDQFTIEQLAGDLLPDATIQQQLATAFNRNHRINTEGGLIPEEFRNEYVVDRVDTTFTIWQGLTMGCVRCHDHKYDPLTMNDFYSAYALFNNVNELSGGNGRGTHNPIVKVTDRHVSRQLESLARERLIAQQKMAQQSPELKQAFEAWLNERRRELQSGEVVAPWTTYVPAQREWEGGSFELLDDQSLRSQLPEPAGGTYRLIGQLPLTTLTALRLEALTDPSFTNASLSRSVNGNFVLSEISARVLHADGTSTELTFSKAVADYSQANFDIGNAIDRNASTGWAVDGHQKRERRVAVFQLAQPISIASDDRLELLLKFESQYAHHNIARFRISVTRDEQPGLENSGPPAEVVAALLEPSPSQAQLQLLESTFRQQTPLLSDARAELVKLEQQLKELTSRAEISVMVMSEMATPRETYLLQRGQYDQPDRERRVYGAIPAIFENQTATGAATAIGNRLDFARWLVDSQNPLTARVVVNREWQTFFGRGIVASVEDFGSQGTLPTHPELLDWLASELIESGWNLQHIQKLIVTSATYRQSSQTGESMREEDPENLWLARGPRFRLSGAAIRDQALAASGLLVRRIGGPSVKPYQPPGLWEEISVQDRNRSTDFYQQDHGADLYRRGLYTFWKRSVAPPQLSTFDAAGRESCVVRLTRTNTPLQALTLLNDVTMIEAARKMAERTMHEAPQEQSERLRYLTRLVGVEPDAELLQLLDNAFAAYSNHFSQQPQAAIQLLAQGESAPSSFEGIADEELAAMTVLASLILNMDAVLSKE